MFLEILVLLLATLLGYGIWLYNRLVHDRNGVLSAWSDIDVQLKRRHELIPKLIDAVKAYTQYEQATQVRVTELRSLGEQAKIAGNNPGSVSEAERKLTQGLRGLLLLAEDYPDLKASDQFSSLQSDISEVERDIQFARRYYNGAVKAYNVRVESFPGNLVAGLFRFRIADYFEW